MPAAICVGCYLSYAGVHMAGLASIAPWVAHQILRRVSRSRCRTGRWKGLSVETMMAAAIAAA